MEYKLVISPDGLVVIERDLTVDDSWNVNTLATEIMSSVSKEVWLKNSTTTKRYPTKDNPNINTLFDEAMFNLGMAGLDRLAYELSIEHRQNIRPEKLKPVGFYTHYTTGLESLDPVSLWGHAYATIVFNAVEPLANMQEFNGRHNEELSIYIDGVVGHYSDKLRTYLEEHHSFRRSLILRNSDAEYLHLLTRTI